MTRNELLIGVGGLVLSVLTYFAGVRRTSKRNAEVDREARIQAVVEDYMQLRQSNRDSGISALLKSGVAALQDETEVREACERIQQRGEKPPLAAIQDRIDGIDSHAFLKTLAEERVNTARDDAGATDRIIQRLRERGRS